MDDNRLPAIERLLHHIINNDLQHIREDLSTNRRLTLWMGGVLFGLYGSILGVLITRL